MSESSDPNADPIDVERLADCGGGNPDDLRQIVALYFETTEAEIAKLREAIASGDLQTVQRIAHTCAGGSGTIGMKAIVPPLRKLEDKARAGTLDGAQELLKQIEMAFNQLQLILREYMR